MSELRQDLISGDWIIVAPERLRRPHDFVPAKRKRKFSPKNSCPFEYLDKKPSWSPVLVFPDKKNWQVAIIPNKYPALSHKDGCAKAFVRGPNKLRGGVGYHDLVITRDHKKNFAELSEGEAFDLLRIMQKWYKMIAKDPCIQYASTFFNWGAGAGASISHPHYQLLSLPIIPPDVQHSLSGSLNYYRKNHKCPHCAINNYELKEGTRIIEKDNRSLAFTPFFSRQPFEVRIFPIKHLPFFEETSVADLSSVAVTLQCVMRRIKKHLNDPDLNFFIHTAPLKNKSRYRHYHWHIEVVPKITIPAGFELSTGVEINVIDPDQAAGILKKSYRK